MWIINKTYQASNSTRWYLHPLLSFQPDWVCQMHHKWIPKMVIWIFLYDAKHLNYWFLGSFSVWFSEKGKIVTRCFTTLKQPSGHPGSTSSAKKTSPPSQTTRSLNSFHYGLWIMLNTDVRCFILWKHSLLLEEALMELCSLLLLSIFTLFIFTVQALLLTGLHTGRWQVHWCTPTSHFKI